MPVQQIYCTHCTYGTSVLELRAGDVADRVLGYSARAASLDRHELKGYYRQIERFLNYYLPADTPPEEKSRLDATTAPRRFFFCPALGNLQMVGQVSYRQSDTAGRIGSYFAHVLFAPIEAVESQPRGAAALAAAAHALPGTPADASASTVVAAPKRAGDSRRGEKREAWPTAKCLQLWDAPWVAADSPDLPLELPPLDSIDALLNGASPVLNDDLLLAFLQTPAGGDFSDPASIVPERWRAKEPAERVDLLVQTMQGLLDLGSHRRDNVLLVVEPSVAALVFYGIARLLPPAVLEGVSFSTYEPSADRLAMTVAATTFFSPETSDVRPDLYRRRGFVWNTYSGRMSDAGRPLGDYARFIVDQLLARGWAAADRLVRGFAEAGVRHPEELATLVGTHRQVDQLLSATPLPGEPWRSSPVAEKYLRGEVRRRLAEAPPGWPELHVVAGSPNHLPVLELVACDPALTDLHGPAQFLLRRLPPEKFAEMLASPRISEAAKLDALQHYVTSFNRLPDACQALWSEEAGASGHGAAPTRPLLEKLLARLPEEVLSLFRSSVPDTQWKSFLRIAMRAGRIESRSQAAIKRMVLEAIIGLDDVRLIEALIEHGDALRSCCPPPEPALGKRLHRILYDLPEHPTHFSTWLDMLGGWTDYFSEPGMAEQRLGHWRKIRAVLLSLRSGESEPPSGLVDKLRKKMPPIDYRGLAESLSRAMPIASYPDDAAGKRKQTALRKIGMAILNRSDVLPAVVWSRMSRFFEYGDWDEGRGRSGGKKRGKKKQRQRSAAAHGRRRNWAIYSLIAAAAVVLMVAVGWSVAHFRGTGAKPTMVATAGSEAARTASSAVGTSPVAAVNEADRPANQSNRSTSPSPAPPKPAPPPRPSSAQPSDDLPHDGQRPQPPPPDDGSPKQTEAAGDADPANTLKPEARATDATPTASPDPTPAKGNVPTDKTTLPPGDLQPPSPPPILSPQADEHDEAVEFITKSLALPSLTSGVLTAYNRVVLEKWREPPESVKMSLLGLDFVNQQLGDERQLVEDFSDGELRVNFVRPTDKRKDSPRLIAMFRCEDDGLSFQWTDLKKANNGINPVREWLRRCALKIERKTALDETESSENSPMFYALVAPAKLSPLPLSNGAASFDQGGLKPPPLPPLADDDLILGRGHVFARDGGIFFGQERTDAAPPYLISDLPEKYNLAAAEIDWQRDARDPNRWHVEIFLPDDELVLEKKGEINENQGLLWETEKLEQLHAEPLRSWCNKDVRALQEEVSAKLNAHATAVATFLNRNPPKCPDATNDLKTLNVVRTDFMGLVAAISDRCNKLRKDRSLLVEGLRDLRRSKRHELALFWADAQSVSATIYRRVDARTLAPYAILGDPGGDSGSNAPATRNNRAGFDDRDEGDDD